MCGPLNARGAGRVHPSMHPVHARAFAPLASALAHAGLAFFFLAAAAPPPTGLGAGPEDLGGEGTSLSFAEPEPDFGPALVDVTTIGIVDDVALAAPAPAPAPAVRGVAEPVPTVTSARPAAERPRAPVAAPGDAGASRP